MDLKTRILTSNAGEFALLQAKLGAPSEVLPGGSASLAEKKLALIEWVANHPEARDAVTEPAERRPPAALNRGPYHSVFLSYSHEDREFADKIYRSLTSRGVEAWMDNQDLNVGEPLEERIANAVLQRDRVLLICSQHSLTSDWVMREVRMALGRERDSGVYAIICLLLDDYFTDTWSGPEAAKLRNRLYGDFRDWKDPESFEQSLERVFKALWSRPGAPPTAVQEEEKPETEPAPPSPARAMSFLPILQRKKLPTDEALQRIAILLKIDSRSARVVLQHLLSSGYIQALGGSWQVTAAGRTAAAGLF